MNQCNSEWIQQAKAAPNAEALLELANANGLNLTASQAQNYYDQLNPKMGELEDDDLDVVAGGRGGCSEGNTITFANSFCSRWTCANCGGVKGQTEIFGSVYRDACTGCGATDVTCRACKYVSGDGVVLHCLHP